MKKTIRVTLFGFLSTVLVGCVPPKPYTWSCPSPSNQQNNESSDPDKIIVQVDSTPSMQGFVRNQGSRYIQTLKLIRSAAGTAFPSSASPEFYSFGTKRLEHPISSFEEVQKAGFYSGSHLELRNAATYKIIKPGKNDPENSLYVIVTDLYQEKAQWEELVDSLKDNYLRKNGYSVGIIAVKSDFRGTIYDVGLNNRKYSNIKTNHPFYILVLGTYSQVKNYFDAIKSGSENGNLDFPDENFIIFSTQIFEKPTFLNVAENPLKPINFDTKSKIRRVDFVNDGNVVVKVDNVSAGNIERLKISNQQSNDAPSQARLEYQISYERLPYTLQLGNSLKYEINEASDFNQSKRDFKSLEGSQLPAPISLNNWESNSDSIKFNALINLDNNAKSGGIYRIVFDVLPEKISGDLKPYKAPLWWNGWSFGDSDKFAGDKTYNLRPFLYDLADKTFSIIGETNKKKESQTFPLARLCFLLHKK